MHAAPGIVAPRTWEGLGPGSGERASAIRRSAALQRECPGTIRQPIGGGAAKHPNRRPLPCASMAAGRSPRCAHRRRQGILAEESVLAPVQQPAVQPVWRRGEADHLQVRVGDAQPIEQPPYWVWLERGTRWASSTMARSTCPSSRARRATDLDARDEDLASELSLAEPGRVDARRRVGPEPDQRRVVLRNQLAHVGDDQDAGLGICESGAASELGEDHALARSGRCRHQRRAAAGAEPGVERVDRRALVVAQLDHSAPRRWTRLPASRQRRRSSTTSNVGRMSR